MKYFLMSKRFNKVSPADFGLVCTTDYGSYTRPNDGTTWAARKLYNLGWGNENGFVRIPPPDFKLLIEIILKSDDQEDRYGAAALVIEDHPNELLEYCEDIFRKDVKSTIQEHLSFFKLLNLNLPTNLSFILGQSSNEIEIHHNRWKEISIRVNQVMMNTIKKY